MAQEQRKCMICGKAVPLTGGICAPCQERIRKEALGHQADQRVEAEKELKKHGVPSEPKRGQK
jgi:predicted nucleic acid-binding Zn ribbon protein